MYNHAGHQLHQFLQWGDWLKEDIDAKFIQTSHECEFQQQLESTHIGCHWFLHQSPHQCSHLPKQQTAMLQMGQHGQLHQELLTEDDTLPVQWSQHSKVQHLLQEGLHYLEATMWRCQFLWKWDQASKPGSRDIHLNGGSNISYRCITTTTASNETDANNKTDFVDPSSQTIWVPCRWQTVWGLWCVPCSLSPRHHTSTVTIGPLIAKCNMNGKKICSLLRDGAISKKPPITS